MQSAEDNLPKWCFDIYTKKLNDLIRLLARSSFDIHAWNAINLYSRNSHRLFFFYNRNDEYIQRCESSFGGNVTISLQPLNKYRNNFDRPLPSLMMGVSYTLLKQIVFRIKMLK